MTRRFASGTPRTARLIKELPKAHANIVQWVAFSPDGKYLASASTDKTVKLWDAKDDKELKSFTGHKDSVYSVAFSKDGAKLASCGNDGLIKIYDVNAKTESKTLMVDLPKKKIEEVKKVEPPKDKDKDKKPKKDAGKKEQPKEIRDAFTVVAFTPDGQHVLTGCNDKFLRYWNISDGKEAKKIGPTPDYIFGWRFPRTANVSPPRAMEGALASMTWGAAIESIRPNKRTRRKMRRP